MSFGKIGTVKKINDSILNPHYSGLRLVLSINNLGGGVNYDLYKTFDKKWRQVKQDAKGWYNTKTGAYKLGAINTTAVQSDTWVIHMLCQDKDMVTDVKSLEECLKHVSKMAKYEQASVHIDASLVNELPAIAGLAETHLVKSGINVYYYEQV